MDFELPLEEKRLQEETRAFVDREIRPLVPDIEKRKSYPIEIVRRMARQGIYRLLVPKEYGGVYETVRSLPICVAREELGRGHNFAGSSIATHGLGSYPLVLAGSSEMRKSFLPRVASGEIIPAFALTEPEAGSDAGSLRASALHGRRPLSRQRNKVFYLQRRHCQLHRPLCQNRSFLGDEGNLRHHRGDRNSRIRSQPEHGDPRH